jgi:hypothetical protein
MLRSWNRVPAIEARLSGGVAAAEPTDLHSSRCRNILNRLVMKRAVGHR